MTETLSNAFNAQKTETANQPEELLIPIDISRCYGNNKQRAVHIINTVAKNSPLGRELLENVAKEGYQVAMFGACGWGGMVCESTKILSLNCCFSDNQLMQIIGHEARHVQQYSNGIDSDCNRYTFKGAVMSHRAKEADAEAASCAVCYEMKQNGVEGPWKEFEADVPLIAKGFMAACTDEKAPFTHKMLQGGFEGWYQNEEMVLRYEYGYLRDGGLSYSWDERNHPETYYIKPITSGQIVETVCRDPAGKCYWSDNPDILEQPEKLAITESTRKKCEQAFMIRKNAFNLKEDKTYQSLPLREELKARKQKQKPANSNAPAPAAAVAKLAAARRGR